MENRSRTTRQQPPVDSESPSREKVETLLRELGAHEEVVVAVAQRHENDDVRTLVTRFRAFARENPAVVLGALSAIVLAGAITVERALVKPSKRKKKTLAAKKTKAKSAKRTLIEPHPGDKRYVRRDKRGRIKESVDVGRSLAADRKQHSKKVAKRGHGDEGDR